MIFRKKPIRYIILWIFIINLISSQLNGQGKTLPGLRLDGRDNFFWQDTTHGSKNKYGESSEQPDTNFTWEKYASFLKKISDTSKYIVLPLNEFRKTFNPDKIVIGLRHDVDNDLNLAYEFSNIETKLGFRATYFILHTAPYYLADPPNKSIHSEKIIPILKSMQNDKKFEIGWHNDLITLQLVYKINPVTFLHQELKWLRDNGINIVGTASHGSTYCKTYHYINYYFFHEFTYPVKPGFENNIEVPFSNSTVPIIKGNLSDFGLEYEAYFLNNNKAFSDAMVTKGVRWNIGMLDLNQLKPGDRVIILLHPIHWHKASVNANIESFRINGQTYSKIDDQNSTITVEMPKISDRNSLIASFRLSPGAFTRISGIIQKSDTTSNNFTYPVHYVVYAENREIHRDWIIKVNKSK